MTDKITLKQLSNPEEASMLDREFVNNYPWYKSNDYFLTCLEENSMEKRITLMAYYEGILAGSCHLLYVSNYPFFAVEKIPEINDLNVFPEYRRRKIASTIFDELERIASITSKSIGLGVGLYTDYGNAQIMYNKRGYIMDGKGIIYNNKQVIPGNSVVVDDELLIYLVKELSESYRFI